MQNAQSYILSSPFVAFARWSYSVTRDHEASVVRVFPSNTITVQTVLQVYTILHFQYGNLVACYNTTTYTVPVLYVHVQNMLVCTHMYYTLHEVPPTSIAH